MAIGFRGGDDSLGSCGSNEGWTETDSNLHEAKKLLKECLYVLNTMPNRKYGHDEKTDTYSLASKVSKFLKQ